MGKFALNLGQNRVKFDGHMNTKLPCLNWDRIKFVTHWCIDFSVVTLFVYTIKKITVQEEIGGYEKLTITSTISRLKEESQDCAKLRLLIICPVKVKSRYPVGTCLLLLTKVGGC